MKPLAGMKVLDLSRVLAGPYCCCLLGEFGAEVIKIERPGQGDDSRTWPAIIDGESAFFLSVNRNKRSITINFQEPEGQDLVRRLAKDADVLVESFTPGTLDKYGLSYEQLREINPQLIYCSISGYGQRGPLARKPGYDGALQAYTGHMSITGEPGRGPVRSGASFIDMTTGIVAFSGILAAVLARQRTGRGQKVSASLLQTGTALLGYHVVNYLLTGLLPKRTGSGLGTLVPYQAFTTKDGYIVTGALNDGAWVRFCSVLGLDHLVDDPRFKTLEDRAAHRDELMPLLEDIFRERTTKEWLEIMEAAHLPASPVNTVADLLSGPQAAANEVLLSMEHPKLGTIQLPAVPLDFSDGRPQPELPPPMLGQHTEEILAEMGFSDDDIARLRQQGVV